MNGTRTCAHGEWADVNERKLVKEVYTEADMCVR